MDHATVIQLFLRDINKPDFHQALKTSYRRYAKKRDDLILAYTCLTDVSKDELLAAEAAWAMGLLELQGETE